MLELVVLTVGPEDLTLLAVRFKALPSRVLAGHEVMTRFYCRMPQGQNRRNWRTTLRGE